MSLAPRRVLFALASAGSAMATLIHAAALRAPAFALIDDRLDARRATSCGNDVALKEVNSK